MNPIKILILTANPKIPNYEPLRLDAEVREIEEALRRSVHRDRFQLKIQLATRTEDLRRALLDHQPQNAPGGILEHQIPVLTKSRSDEQ